MRTGYSGRTVGAVEAPTRAEATEGLGRVRQRGRQWANPGKQPETVGSGVGESVQKAPQDPPFCPFVDLHGV